MDEGQCLKESADDARSFEEQNIRSYQIKPEDIDELSRRLNLLALSCKRSERKRPASSSDKGADEKRTKNC